MFYFVSLQQKMGVNFLRAERAKLYPTFKTVATPLIGGILLSRMTVTISQYVIVTVTCRHRPMVVSVSLCSA